MSTSALEEYLTTIPDAQAEPMVRELDRIIRKSHSEFDVAIKYKILMYALNGDFHTWVCAVNAGRRKVSLNFLYGVLLDDRKKVLRAGSSVLMTWDIGFDEDLDAAAVAAYVAEAVKRNPDYIADRENVLDMARQAAAKAGRRPKSPPGP
ncbi:MAG: DUF1801 domain-containing protein [Chloroflexota bacterium]